MSVTVKRIAIGEGINLTSIQDARFKTNRLSFQLIVPLDRENASANAMIPFLMRKGYRGCMDYTELNQKLSQLYGAGLFTDVLKVGDFQLLNVAISAIDDSFALDKEEVAAKAADILCRLVLDPAFLQDGFDLAQFDLEKQALVDAIEAEINEKTSYAVQRAIANMCADEPYGIHKYGNVDSVKKLTLEDVISAYRKVMKHARIEIYFVGCGDASGIVEQLKRDFAGLERTPVESADSIKVLKAGSVNTVEEHYAVAQAKLVMGFRAGAETPEQMEHARLMALLYGGTPRSKLFLNVREKLSLCYYCSAQLERNKGIMLVNSGVEFDNVGKAKEEILRQLDEVKKGAFSDEELEETKLMIVDSLKTVNDSASSMEMWYLSHLFLHSEISPEQEAERLCRITREEVIAAANRVTMDTIYILEGEE
ncbi:MAG: EF-P 5-aminopentanol modification-associated protein YfmF [Oscillospiraceae bacterium]|jgi:predicted Zn-dependent peptidase